MFRLTVSDTDTTLYLHVRQAELWNKLFITLSCRAGLLPSFSRVETGSGFCGQRFCKLFSWDPEDFSWAWSMSHCCCLSKWWSPLLSMEQEDIVFQEHLSSRTQIRYANPLCSNAMLPKAAHQSHDFPCWYSLVMFPFCLDLSFLVTIALSGHKMCLLGTMSSCQATQLFVLLV